ncbi:hypothetical protein CapIbe_001250 [Capra ibex]
MKGRGEELLSHTATQRPRLLKTHVTTIFNVWIPSVLHKQKMKFSENNALIFPSSNLPASMTQYPYSRLSFLMQQHQSQDIPELMFQEKHFFENPGLRILNPTCTFYVYILFL